MPRRKFISGVSDRGSDIVDTWTRQLDHPQKRWNLSGALALAPARNFVPAWETTVRYTKRIRSVASFALDCRSDHPARSARGKRRQLSWPYSGVRCAGGQPGAINRHLPVDA